MTPDQLAHELLSTTRKLLLTAGDPEGLEPLLQRRAALVVEIANCPATAFTRDGRDALTTALRDGDALEQNLKALRRQTSSEWARLNAMRFVQPAENTLSFSG